MKNKVAKVLQIGAIILLCMSIIGAIAVSFKDVVKEKKSDYSWEDSSYETVKEFDFSVFFTSFVNSLISCSLIYAFGELIKVEDDKKALLEQILNKEN